MSDPIQQDPVYQQMATLLNYESISSSFNTENTVINPEEAQYLHPEDEPSTRQFSQRGWTKAGFVTGVTILCFFFVGFALNQIFGPKSALQVTESKDVYEEQDTLTLTLNDPTAESNQEVGLLRTEVALQKQAQQLESMQAELQASDQSTSPNTAENLPQDVPAKPEDIAPVTEIIQTQSPPVPQPTVSPLPTPPVPQPTVSPRPIPQIQEPTPDPPTAWEQWMAISNSGRLGVVPPETFTSAPGFSPASPAITSRSNSPSLPPPQYRITCLYFRTGNAFNPGDGPTVFR